MATEHTRLIYMTTGVLLQKLVQAKCLTEYSHIFVDEVKSVFVCLQRDFYCLRRLKPFRWLDGSNFWLIDHFGILSTLLCRRFMSAIRRWTLSFWFWGNFSVSTLLTSRQVQVNSQSLPCSPCSKASLCLFSTNTNLRSSSCRRP